MYVYMCTVLIYLMTYVSVPTRYIHIYIYKYTYVGICIYVCIHINILMYVCIHAYTHMAPCLHNTVTCERKNTTPT